MLHCILLIYYFLKHYLVLVAIADTYPLALNAYLLESRTRKESKARTIVGSDAAP